MSCAFCDCKVKELFWILQMFWVKILSFFEIFVILSRRGRGAGRTQRAQGGRECGAGRTQRAQGGRERSGSRTQKAQGAEVVGG